MADRILILGCCGRIGSQVTQDLITHTEATLVVTGRNKSQQFILKDLSMPLLILELILTSSPG